MRLALMIEGQEGVTWEQWVALAEACEQHGSRALFRSDHYILHRRRGGGSLATWTTLAALAASTSESGSGRSSRRRRSATRHCSRRRRDRRPISGGRIELGIGAGWKEAEHRAAGFPFPPMRERVELFAEQLEILHRSGRRTASTSTAATTTRGRARPPEAGAAAAPADHRGRQRAARHCRSGRALRRRVQQPVRLAGRLRRDPRGSSPPASAPGASQRQCGSTTWAPDRRDAGRCGGARARAVRPRTARHRPRRVARGLLEPGVVGSVDEVAEQLRRVRTRGLRPRHAPAPPPRRSRAGQAHRTGAGAGGRVTETGTTRMERCGDGIFAIAATLLVLEFSVGAYQGTNLGSALLHLWPSYLAYVTSSSPSGSSG